MKPTGKITKAQYEAMSHSERVSYQKKRLGRKKRQRDRLIFGIVLIFVCAVGVTLSFTVFFKIATVEAAGFERYTSEQIVAESGIDLQSNMFMLSTDKAAQQLQERLPYIGKAVVRRSLPDKIVIDVTETAAALAVAEPGGFTLLDENCKVLEKSVPVRPEGTALLLGVDTASILPGFYIAGADDGNTPEQESVTDQAAQAETTESAGGQPAGEKKPDNAVVLQTLLTVTAGVRDAEFADVTAYDFSNMNQIKIIYQDRLTVLIGTATNLEQKLRLAKRTIADENEKRPMRTGLVDVSTGSKASVRNEEHTTGVDETTEPVTVGETTTRATE
ncbi:MAG: FtsQ-type POTRA domain-containing protein [Oscillospiraceae bacterium]|nr:FtsQ-type POTRA domain-containing protein [Oscillospiraceae bacterium]